MAKKQTQQTPNTGIRLAGHCVVTAHDSRWHVFSQRELAAALGVNSQTAHSWVQSGLPRWPAGQRRFLYCIPCACQWLRSRRQAPTHLDDDQLMNGPATPALERFREARAATVEHDLAEKRKQLMSVEMFERIIAAALSPLARFGDRMTARYGLEFAESWQDAVEQFTATVEEVCKPYDESED